MHKFEKVEESWVTIQMLLKLFKCNSICNKCAISTIYYTYKTVIPNFLPVVLLVKIFIEKFQFPIFNVIFERPYDATCT